MPAAMVAALPAAVLRHLTAIWKAGFTHFRSYGNTLGTILYYITFLYPYKIVLQGYIPLQKLQKRAARIITNSSFDAPSRPLIEKLGWKTVYQLISSESKTMVFKSLNELAPQYLCDPFTRKSLYSSYSLRNTGTDLRLPMKRSTNGQKCFSYGGAKLWNSLSAKSKQATSLYSFKKTI